MGDGFHASNLFEDLRIPISLVAGPRVRRRLEDTSMTKQDGATLQDMQATRTQ